MEWTDLKAKIEETEKMDPKDVEAIIKQGIQSPFWHYLQTRLANTLKLTEMAMKQNKGASLDDCIKHARLSAIYSTAYELLNFADAYFASQQIQKNLSPKTSPNARRTNFKEKQS